MAISSLIYPIKKVNFHSFFCGLPEANHGKIHHFEWEKPTISMIIHGFQRLGFVGGGEGGSEPLGTLGAHGSLGSKKGGGPVENGEDHGRSLGFVSIDLESHCLVGVSNPLNNISQLG